MFFGEGGKKIRVGVSGIVNGFDQSRNRTRQGSHHQSFAGSDSMMFIEQAARTHTFWNRRGSLCPLAQ